ncbi:MAG: sigma-54-dependent Fis family transcriptional regulator [Desulfovibrio sp.]|nr:sigma-54-dependent Fis family transcriptional regulator [Desulfovibrio sp.]
MQARILIVEDDKAHRSMLKTLLTSWGYVVLEAEDGDEALGIVRKEALDLVLSDVRMGKMDGIATLSAITDYNPALPVLLMTAYSSVETAVEALRLGACDYLLKPLDFAALKSRLSSCLARHTLLTPKSLSQQAETSSDLEILAKSAPMLALLETIHTVAPTEATVLITGASGTGKELVAKALHRLSKRAQKPFVAVNCAALAENLLESELFGHEKGAFTGAEKRRDGRFVQADGGTIFLDEIGELPLSLQAKLLRTLQEGEVQRVGQDTSITVHVRVLAATNRNLEEEVHAGRFREDLFFRLNVIALHLPLLKDRIADIPLLAAHFLERFAKKNDKAVHGFAPQVMDAFLHYSWPGNVRELSNVVERAVILAKENILGLETLPEKLLHSEETCAVQDLEGLTLDRVERLAIEQTLKATNENKSETARRLGITRATLHSKLKKYALDKE